ncbi:heavy-metal-associated domain-containing protein [Chitinophaga defluvii]|uniref:Cation transporter n=1 Tax=Chitinophaga defluvii TaxID=3163343 RepID=A0ABV2TEN1_9BACT|nr:cation transporter [Bacteroidota bacterium]MBS1771272.1 cation transporter [Bacteroidota bacterium]
MENNKEFQFKTNLNCGGCVSKVQSDLDNAEGICHWNVDTNNADKILTVKSEGITEDEVVAIVKSKGFKIEPLTA